MRYIVIAKKIENDIDKYLLVDLKQNKAKYIKDTDIIDIINKGINIENVYIEEDKIKDNYFNLNDYYMQYYVLSSENNKHNLVDINGNTHSMNNDEICGVYKTIINPDKLKITNINKRYPYYSGELISERYSKIITCDEITPLYNEKYIKYRMMFSSFNGSLSTEIPNKVIIYSDIKNDNGILSIDDAIINDDFYALADKNSIDKFIRYKYTYNNFKAVLDEESPINCIIVSDFDINNSPIITDENIINEAKNIINDLKIPFYIKIEKSMKNYVINREVGKYGIYYSIIDYRAYDAIDASFINKVSLEELITNKEQYVNIKVDSESITVYGIDGVYKYNFDKLQEEFNNKPVKTNRQLKYNILGIDYKEKINSNGKLLHLQSSSEELVIPSDVNVISTKSIALRAENNLIKFPSTLKDISNDCFDCTLIECNQSINIQTIDIGVDFNSDKLIKNLIESINKSYIDFEESRIMFNRKIRPIELGYILNCNYYLKPKEKGKNINLSKWTEDDAKLILNIMLDGSLKNIQKASNLEKYNKREVQYELGYLNTIIRRLETFKMSDDSIKPLKKLISKFSTIDL